MPAAHTILARGPWEPAAVETVWREDEFQAPARNLLAADAAIEKLRERGSPSHDGVAARLAGYSLEDGHLTLELQPLRWALRLVPRDSSQALSSLTVVRDHQGRWLAGKRADWLATWPGRWSLGAGGAVEVGENPVQTLIRELEEEWSVAPERVRVEALLLSQQNSAMLVGQAWLPEHAEVTPDHEHDEYAWWPADVAQWPRAGHIALRRTAELVA
ncbi:MAG TPA: NUDIX domain-containing protein [Baekduia sp.]|nr:NUDIX domain-containing protein [Baekduia sp.]